MKGALITIDLKLKAFADSYKAKVTKDRFKGEWDIPKDFEQREIGWTAFGMDYHVGISPLIDNDKIKEWCFAVSICKVVKNEMFSAGKTFFQGSSKRNLIKDIDKLLEEAKQYISTVSEKDLKPLPPLHEE